ncbi:hypothetical protein JHK82_039928 [Glycine max]|nr:hypothetical protein JHK82_039928 [Glycine max]
MCVFPDTTTLVLSAYYTKLAEGVTRLTSLGPKSHLPKLGERRPQKTLGKAWKKSGNGDGNGLSTLVCDQVKLSRFKIKNDDLEPVNRSIIVKFEYHVCNTIPSILTVGNFDIMSELRETPFAFKHVYSHEYVARRHNQEQQKICGFYGRFHRSLDPHALLPSLLRCHRTPQLPLCFLPRGLPKHLYSSIVSVTLSYLSFGFSSNLHFLVHMFLGYVSMLLYHPQCGILTFFLGFGYLIGWFSNRDNECGEVAMDPSIMKLLEDDEEKNFGLILLNWGFAYPSTVFDCSHDEAMHSGVDVEAFQAALNRDIGGDVSSHETSLVARCHRVYAHAHDYHINSISNNSDGETFISANDLRINLWKLEISNQSFNIVDVKPANMEDMTALGLGKTGGLKVGSEKQMFYVGNSLCILRQRSIAISETRFELALVECHEPMICYDLDKKRNSKGRHVSFRIHTEMDIRESGQSKPCSMCRIPGHSKKIAYRYVASKEDSTQNNGSHRLFNHWILPEKNCTHSFNLEMFVQNMILKILLVTSNWRVNHCLLQLKDTQC